MNAGTISGLYFFFQAEDGIRDKLVTGVQTCALPISSRSSRLSPSARRSSSACTMASTVARDRSCRGARRSEERRVGKECRSRWSAYDEKNNAETARQPLENQRRTHPLLVEAPARTVN